MTSELFAGVYRGGTALCNAVKKMHYEATKCLLAAGADTNKTDSEQFTPLHIAALHHDDLEFIALLLQYNSDVNNTSVGDSALHLVIMRGHEKAAELLIRHGADVNLVNDVSTLTNSYAHTRHVSIPYDHDV